MEKERVETVIVGGGIVGCAVAHYLAEEGSADTIVLEAAELGSGSTAGSAGGVRQQFSTPFEIEFSRRGHQFWRTAERVFDSPVPFYEDGYLFITGRPEILRGFAEAADLQRRGGMPDVEMLDAEGVAAVVPWIDTTGLLGGCYTPKDGHVRPADGVAALVKAARAAGVRFRERSPVRGMERSNGGWLVDAGDGIEASRVVVCTGYRATEFMRPFGLNLTLKPLPMYYAITEPALPGQPVPLTIDFDTGFFVEREGERLSISILYDENPVPFGHTEMLLEFARVAETRAPVLMDIQVFRHLVGNVDRGGDGHPYVGEVERDLWMAAGFGGHGTMHGPVVAQLLAKSIAGRPDPTIDLSPLDPWRPQVSEGEWLVAGKKE